jgi:hypothetical protein
MSTPRQKDAVQGREDLEALCRTARALRDRAGISKDKLSVRISGSRRAPCVTLFATLDEDDYARLDLRSMREILDSFEERVWHGIDPDDLRRWLKEGLNGSKAAERPKKKAPAASPTGWEGGWFRVYHSIIETGLFGAMPAPAAKAYIVCFNYAGPDGSFYISHQSLAEKIGAKRREHGRDTMRLLRSAGLVKLERAGAPGRASDYRLVSLSAQQIEHAKSVLASGSRRPSYGGPTDPMYQGPADPTIKTHHQEPKTSARSERARSRNEKRAPSALSITADR